MPKHLVRFTYLFLFLFAANLVADDLVADDKDKKDDDKSSNGVTVTIDEDGIFDRAVALDLPARNYVALLKGPKHKVFIAEAIPNERGLKVHSYDVEKEKATRICFRVSGWGGGGGGQREVGLGLVGWFVSVCFRLGNGECCLPPTVALLVV